MSLIIISGEHWFHYSCMSAGRLTAMESCGKVKKTGLDASGAWVSTRSASNCFPTCVMSVRYLTMHDTLMWFHSYLPQNYQLCHPGPMLKK